MYLSFLSRTDHFKFILLRNNGLILKDQLEECFSFQTFSLGLIFEAGAETGGKKYEATSN